MSAGWNPVVAKVAGCYPDSAASRRVRDGSEASGVLDVWSDCHQSRPEEVGSVSCLLGWGFPRALGESTDCFPSLGFHQEPGDSSDYRPTQDCLQGLVACWRRQAGGCYPRGCRAKCSVVHLHRREPGGPWEIPLGHLASMASLRCQTKDGFVASEPVAGCCPPTGDSSEARGEPCHRPPWDGLRLRPHDPWMASLLHRHHPPDPVPAPAGRRESPPKGPTPGPCYSRQILTIS